MKILGSVLPSNAAVLATTIGAALALGIAFAPPLAAQEKTATQLDEMEQQIAPPPVVDADADRSDVPRSEDRGDVRWSQLDSDGDGRISRSEGSADPDFDSNFEMVDADNDGYISATEQGAREAEDLPEAEEDDELR